MSELTQKSEALEKQGGSGVVKLTDVNASAVATTSRTADDAAEGEHSNVSIVVRALVRTILIPLAIVIGIAGVFLIVQIGARQRGVLAGEGAADPAAASEICSAGPLESRAGEVLASAGSAANR